MTLEVAQSSEKRYLGATRRDEGGLEREVRGLRGKDAKLTQALLPYYPAPVGLLGDSYITRG